MSRPLLHGVPAGARRCAEQPAASQPARRLWGAVLRQALQDACEGDATASAWLAENGIPVADCAALLRAAGIWAPERSELLLQFQAALAQQGEIALPTFLAQIGATGTYAYLQAYRAAERFVTYGQLVRCGRGRQSRYVVTHGEKVTG